MRISKEARKYLAKIGAKGGKKGGRITAAKMTPEELRARAAKGAAKREENKRNKKEGK